MEGMGMVDKEIKMDAKTVKLMSISIAQWCSEAHVKVSFRGCVTLARHMIKNELTIFNMEDALYGGKYLMWLEFTYQKILGRGIDDDIVGMAVWSMALYRDELTQEEVVQKLMESEERRVLLNSCSLALSVGAGEKS